MVRRMTRFLRDARGVGALEFALIAPMLIAGYFALAQLAQVMMVHKRITHVSSAIGDLVAQSESLTPSDMTDIFSAATTILSPYTTNSLSLRVTSVTLDANGSPKVDWCVTQGSALTDTANGATTVLPANLITASGENVIVAEARYTYTSPVSAFSKTYNEKSYLWPRKVAKVTCTNC